MSRGFRRERLAREIFRQLSLVLQREMKDPRFALLTLTRVELSKDLAFARIYVADYEKRPGRDNILAALNSARTYLRSRVIQEIRMRKPPEFQFVQDKGAENVLAVERELRHLKGNSGAAPEPEAGGKDAGP